MIDNIRKLQDDVTSLRGRLKKLKSKQVSSAPLLNSVKETVDFYFRQVREKIVDKSSVQEIVSKCDSHFQDLLSFTHKSSSTNKYKTALNKTKTELIKLEQVALVGQPNKNNNDNIEDIDKRIINTLNGFIPSSALSYKQAILDLQFDSRLSWRGPATDLRESLRECLDYLAPDKEVEEQPGFKLENDRSGPTMKQKVQYILKKRKLSDSQIKPAKSAISLIDELFGGFVRLVYNRASVSTHSPTDKNEVKKIKEYVKLVFLEVLELE